MLNKLLKRCMPWMDKGRWYHVRFESEINTDNTVTFTKVIYDPLFSSHEINDINNQPVLNLYFKDQESVKCIIDIKSIIHYYGDPVMPAGSVSVGYSPTDYLGVHYDGSKGWSLQIMEPSIGSIDLWLFVRRF